MPKHYAPPYHITPTLLHTVEHIGEALGRLRVLANTASIPHLRRDNRLRTIQASLQIEGNTRLLRCTRTGRPSC